MTENRSNSRSKSNFGKKLSNFTDMDYVMIPKFWAPHSSQRSKRPINRYQAEIKLLPKNWQAIANKLKTVADKMSSCYRNKTEKIEFLEQIGKAISPCINRLKLLIFDKYRGYSHIFTLCWFRITKPIHDRPTENNQQTKVQNNCIQISILHKLWTILRSYKKPESKTS